MATSKSSAESLLISLRQIVDLYSFAIQLRDLVDRTGKLRIEAVGLGILGEPLRELLDEVIRLRIEAVGVCNQLEEVIGRVAPKAIAVVKTRSLINNEEKTPTQISRPCSVCYAIVYPGDLTCRVCGHTVTKVSTVRKKNENE